jgi:conjugal transfer pilus assembly protein TrbC
VGATRVVIQVGLILIVGFISPSYALAQKLVFVSFSMPEKLMLQTLKDASVHKIPVLLNGLVDDSMPKTIKKIMSYTQKAPDLAIQIDPESFQKYQIKKVPALVSDNGQVFDVVYGNNRLAGLIDEIQRKGESSL